MTRLLLYGYVVGQRSSRQLEKATYDEVLLRYLAADQHPNQDTIAAFCHEHLSALAGLFVPLLRLCRQIGLAKLGHVAIDGTKMGAYASHHRSWRRARHQRPEPTAHGQ